MSLNERHAAYVRWVLGIARRYVPLNPILDDADELTDRLRLDVPEGRIVVVVPPPPKSWTQPVYLDHVPDDFVVGVPCPVCAALCATEMELAVHLDRHASEVESGGGLNSLPPQEPPRASKRVGGALGPLRSRQELREPPRGRSGEAAR